MPYMSPRSIVDEIGMQTIAEATKKDPRTIRRWCQRGKFPAREYTTISNLTNGLAPKELFTFSENDS